MTGQYFVDRDGTRNLTTDDEVVAGATVRLLRNGVEVATTTTDANGVLCLHQCRGRWRVYRVAFEDPTDSLGQDLEFITDRIGGDSLIDSDVIWTDGRGDGTTRKFSMTGRRDR